MRFPWLPLVLALCASFISADLAHAQIERHNLRVYLEGGLVSWSKATLDYGDYETTSTATSVGPLVNGGIGAGFALTRLLIPTLSFSMQRVKAGQGDTPQDLRVWELRPELEIALLPSLRFVPFVHAGLSFMRSVDKDGDPSEFIDGEPKDLVRFGYGPVLGVGLHTFVLEHASLDLGLTYRMLIGFLLSPPVTDDEGNLVVVRDAPLHSLLLTLSASFWLL